MIILRFFLRVLKGDTEETNMTVVISFHLVLTARSHQLALKGLPAGPYTLHIGADMLFGAWQDLAGQTLTRPFRARPRKCHLACVNDYHSNGRVTCNQREPRSLHLSASHFPCPLFIRRQVNYSSCTAREAHVHCINTFKKTAHSVC